MITQGAWHVPGTSWMPGTHQARNIALIFRPDINTLSGSFPGGAGEICVSKSRFEVRLPSGMVHRLPTAYAWFVEVEAEGPLRSEARAS